MEEILECKKVISNIRRELKKYVVDNGLKSLVIGISSGIDSSVVSAICKPICNELKIPLIGRSISIETNTKDEEKRADDIGKAFVSNYRHVNLTKNYHDLITSIEMLEGIEHIDLDNIDYTIEMRKKMRIRRGNLKSRLRMCYLYNLSHMHNGVVVGSDNLSEGSELGCSFYTLFGDGAFDYGLLVNLWKTEVYELANYIVEHELTNNFQKESLRASINAQPTDGLGISKTDCEQLGAKNYDEVDSILKEYHSLKYNIDEKSIKRLLILNQHPVIKRHLAGKFKALIPITVPRKTLFN